MPTALRELRGNPSGKAYPTGEPEPDIAEAEAPTHLNGVARAEWERLAPELIRLRLLTVVDLGLLAAWCVAWSDFVVAKTALATGIVVKGKDDHLVRSPWFIVKYKAVEAMVRISDRMGFSPSARVSLVSGAPRLPNAIGTTDRTPKRGSLAEYLAHKPDRLD